MSEDSRSREELLTRIRELETEIESYSKEVRKAQSEVQNMIVLLRQEVAVAKSIQKTMVPTVLPSIPGFEISNKFQPSPTGGGDFFDIINLNDKQRFGILLASASGYSLSSLLMTLLLKVTYQPDFKRGAPPQLVLEKILSELKRSIKPGDRANLFYTVIDRRELEMIYSGVGKVWVFHLLAHSDRPAELRSLNWKTPPLTEHALANLEAHQVQLNPGDRLILCSEGVLRVTNRQGEEWGKERLQHILLAFAHKDVHDLRNEIFFQIQKFSGRQVLKEDLTVLVLEVKERLIRLATL